MYSIKDVSEKTGLSAHTLRYYEREGLLSGVEPLRSVASTMRKLEFFCIKMWSYLGGLAKALLVLNCFTSWNGTDISPFQLTPSW